ncbi:FKBP-type peptidyl-prolyl cis-trans isomerase [Geofilum rubicundum]|uniref:FKBP-type peptidyl-prolyl cis-trans isomerase n=1 Tax=Geofilum rubicundum TaxID=472113 RepID=UPI000A03A32F
MYQCWYSGFAQLKKGSKAVFLIPDSLAYGDSRRGIIPPNAALMFEVELLRIK